MEESLKILDSVVLNFNSGTVHIINLVLAFIMFGVALEIKIEDFKNLLKTPAPVIAGFTSQFLVLPALTFLLVILIKPTPTVALGMILVAACPGGNISNFISAVAKANTALSVSLTALATLSAIILTPFNFSFWGKMYLNFVSRHDAGALLRPIEIDVFQVFQTVFILLGIPLIIGLLVAKYFPNVTKKISKPIRIISVVIFLGIVIGALMANLEHFMKFIHLIFIIVLIHNGLALGSGFLVGWGFSGSRANRRTITIETGIQNSGLALALIFNPKIFPPDLQLGGMAIIAAWWGIWHIVSGLLVAWLWSKKELNDDRLTGMLKVFKKAA